MPPVHRAAVIGLVVATVAVGAAAASATLWHAHTASSSIQSGSHGLVTGFLLEDEPDSTQVVIDKRIATTGSTIVRIHALWSEIAPATPGSKFEPTNPADPEYAWQKLDASIQHAHAAGLQVLLTVTGAPHWAERGGTGYATAYAAYNPDPKAFGQFATALAKRYDGSFRGLPRIRYFEVWNEPNVSFYFTPQSETEADGTKVNVAATLYRALVNSFADAVHQVDRNNIVVAGSLAPFTIQGVSYVESTGGIHFLRELLCLSLSGPPRPTCSAKAHFDALSFHPYTSGGPTHHALNPGDLSLGDMPAARAVLAAGIKAGHVVSSMPVGMWVTEFSWDTNPPDPQAVPAGLQARWVAEALFRMWKNGVSRVIWYQVRDWAYPGTDYQSGLYFKGATLSADRPKPGLLAFHFPFVAYAAHGRIAFWGRDENSTSARVTIQLRTGGRWRTVGTKTADRFGIFQGSFASAARQGVARAVVDNVSSRSFSLQPPANENMAVTPFGVGSKK